MIIDAHLHERTYSPDSEMSLTQLVATAKARGLDGICVTDHDAIGLAAYAAQVAARENFPIFVGVEYLSAEGDIVAFGINSLPDLLLPAQEFIDYVTSRGGVCIAAHPYRNNNRGLGDRLYSLQNLCGVEVLNGSTDAAANQQALDACTKLGLKPFGVSDAHVTAQVGVYATEVPGYFTTVSQLVQAIKSGECRAVRPCDCRPCERTA